jgi:hypothetical protein
MRHNKSLIFCDESRKVSKSLIFMLRCDFSFTFMQDGGSWGTCGDFVFNFFISLVKNINNVFFKLNRKQNLNFLKLRLKFL